MLATDTELDLRPRLTAALDRNLAGFQRPARRPIIGNLYRCGTAHAYRLVT